MKEIILEVSKRYSHRGRGIRHRSGTKRQWYVFYLNEEGNFRAKRIHSIQVPYYKSKICKRITCICGNCEERYLVYVKHASEVHSLQCPNRCEIPSLLTTDDILEAINEVVPDES
jgi:hypothetical protein